MRGNRGGRPTKGAAEAGMTAAELARKALLGVQITPRLSTEQNQFIRSLAGMANNLNQIARKANAAGYRDARGEYLYLAERIDNLLNQLEK